MNKILFILLTALPIIAVSATCPEGMLDGVLHGGGYYSEEYFACYKGKIYPNTLKYCAEKSEDNKSWRGNEGFYSDSDYKCVEGKVISKLEDVCNKGKLGPGGVYRKGDFFCKEGVIYSDLTKRRVN